MHGGPTPTMTAACALAALLALCLPLTAYAEVLSLSELTWTLKNQNGSIAIPAQVPSQAHLDLLRAGIIDEPLLGTNGEHWSGFDVACV